MSNSFVLELENINIDSIDATELFEVLYYDYFCVDFVDNKTYLNKTIYINPQSNKKDDGKEKSFWHLTSKTQSYQKKEGKRYITYTERLRDYSRAKRLAWVKQIIENHDYEKIKLFYHKETTNKKPIRLYLWHYQEDFVVILQKLGKSSSFLVTSFYITHDKKRRDYQKRYEIYVKKLNPNLYGCEWF
ncbi:MAG: hypothetical protein KAU90_04085 [Sulfurovaceae bacterium]|nr:hypothetical protein [Sulfurovaceae bacterium]